MGSRLHPAGAELASHILGTVAGTGWHWREAEAVSVLVLEGRDCLSVQLV